MHESKEAWVTDWIVIVVLYVLGVGMFGLLGGIASAADAFRQWGRASSELRTTPSPSS